MYLEHLERLHDTLETPAGDELHVWWIYAIPAGDYETRPPTDAEYEPFPASNEGIACVDDVARTAVVYLTHYRLRGDDRSRERARQALEFVRYMQRDDGHFLNFVTDPGMNEEVFGESDPDVVNGVRVDGTMTSQPKLAFWSTRACWALGEGYRTFAGEDDAFADTLSDALDAYLDVLESGPLSSYGDYETKGGVEVPAWLPNGDTYTTAPAVLGLAAYCREADDERARTALRRLADGLQETGSGDTVAYPFGAHIGKPPGQPWHTWGLRQAPALARAGDVLGAAEYVDAARNEVAALHTLHCSSGAQIAGFGPAPLPYHQLSYGTDALVHGCTELWRATGDTSWARLGAQLGAWYHGNNVDRTRMFDTEAGRGYDGVYEDAIDLKAGAESTVAAVRTMLDIEQYPEGAGLAGPVTAVDDHSFTLVDAEEAETNAWATRFDPERSSAVFSGGRVVKVFEPGEATLDPGVEPGEYRPYVVVERTIAPESTVVVDVGDQRRTLSIGDADNARYEFRALDPVEVDDGNRVTLSYRGARDRSAHIDALVFHPAVAWRTVVGDGGRAVAAVVRSVVEDSRTATVALPRVDPGALSVRSLDATGESVRTFDGDPDEPPENGPVAYREGAERDSAAGNAVVEVPVEPRGFTLVRARTAETTRR